MPEAEKAKVIVMRVADMDEPAEPSTEVVCGACEATCWFGESTARAVAQFEAHEFVCMRCMAQEFAASGPPDDLRSPWGAVPEPVTDAIVRWTIAKYGI